MLLRVENLEARYGDIRALQGVNLEVEERQIVAVVGSNGAGKSTLLRAISGVLPPSGGRIEFAGRDITRAKAHEIVGLGIAHVPEGRLLFSRMTVEQNLILGAFTKKSQEERGRVLRDIYRVFPRLAERKHQRAGTMSGGEQQMLAIARGLMSQPRLLMLDEPSLGIAPKLVAEIMEMIREINRQGMTILLVEQNVHTALQMADQAYVLQTGRVVHRGHGEELLQSDEVRRAYLGV